MTIVEECMRPPACDRCHETSWGDACKGCGAGRYTTERYDVIDRMWEMSAQYLRVLKLIRELHDDSNA